MSRNENDEGRFDLNQLSGGRTGFFREIWDFLWHNKKWWMVPIFVAIFVLTALAILMSTGAAPFLYPLF